MSNSVTDDSNGRLKDFFSQIIQLPEIPLAAICQSPAADHDHPRASDLDWDGDQARFQRVTHGTSLQPYMYMSPVPLRQPSTPSFWSLDLLKNGIYDMMMQGLDIASSVP